MPIIESSPLHLALVLLVAIKIVGLVLLFDPASVTPFEGPKASFSLATASVLAALVGLTLFESGARQLVRSWLHLVVAAFALANLVAVLFAQDQYVALFGAQRRLGLTFVLDMVVLYLAVAVAYRTTRDWTILGAAVALAGAFSIGYGLTQSLGLDPIRWVDDVRGRPPSTFGNPDKFGHFLGATCAAAVGTAFVAGPRVPRLVRLVALLYAAAALGMAAIVATRGTIIGLAAALLVLGALVALRNSSGAKGFWSASRRARTRTVVIAGGAMLGLVVIAGALALATPLGERLRTGFTDAGSQQRLFLADAAVRAFVDRPLTGHGPDNFGVIYPHYRPAAASPDLGQDSAHSWPLQALATTGLLGTISFAAVVVLSLVLLWRASATHFVAIPLLAGAVAYWVHGLVAFGSVSIDWMGWVAAGGAAALSRPAEATERRVAPLVKAVVIAAGVALALSGYAALQAGREAYIARTARTPDRAIQSAARAVALDPGRAEYWFALGQAQRGRGALADAAAGYRAAAERAPYVSAYWANLALALTDLVARGDQSLGGKAAALDAARRAVDADPASSRPHHVLAAVTNSLGDPAAALEAITVAIRLNPSDPEYDGLAADAALRMPDAVAARGALERIVAVKDSAVLRVALAQTSIKLNDLAMARAHLRRAIELDPQNAPARDLTRQIGP